MDHHSIKSGLLSFLLIIFEASLHLESLHSTLIFLFLSALTLYYISRPRSVYLVDYSCFHPPSILRASSAGFIEHSKLHGFFKEENLEFQKMILARSGLGEETSFPESLHYLPARTSFGAATQEAEMVIFGAVERLFSTTNLHPSNIGALITNCSLFTPIPSFSTMIINKYKLRSNIKSFNLSGMGCSAGLISIALAKDLLQVYKETYVLVVSTENVTLNWYFGNKRSMLLPNCLFRIGAAAMLLSNRAHDKRKSKYELMHVVRTTMAAEDRAYGCVIQTHDDEGKVGVHLSKDLMAVAGDAIKANMRTLGPLVLPYTEQLAFAMDLVMRKMIKSKKNPYVPSFRRAFQHICIHAGGRAVIDEIEKRLSLSEEDVEASRMTLYRFGNTSSSSIWYELSYIEAKRRMKKGDLVWQIAFGSGFKCNSGIWKVIGDKTSMDANNNPWKDTVHDYPLTIPKINTMCD